jgi:hypothetical protein
VHADGWRGERVVWWEDEGAPVLAVVVGCVRGADEDVVPFENVGFGGVGGYVWWWTGLDGLVFPRQAFVGGFGGHGG